MFGKNDPKTQGKIIDIESGMKGDLKFSTPVNLKINSRFEGTLDTKGMLVIGDRADVRTRLIKGEDIAIGGKVEGNIISTKRLALLPAARIVGNITAPVLLVSEGAMLKGRCEMPVVIEKSDRKDSGRSKKKKK